MLLGNNPLALMLGAKSLDNKLLGGELYEGALLVFILTVMIRIFRDQTSSVADLKKT